MWIDINAYTGHWPYKQLYKSTLPGLIDRMNRFGIDQAVVANLDGIHFKNTQPAHDALLTEIQAEKHYRNRLIPFGVINPSYPGWESDLETCVKRGVKGVRIYPQYHDYLPGDSASIDLVKRCRQLGIVVGLTIRMVDSRQRSWLDIPHVAGTANSEWTLKNFMPLIRAVPDANYFVLNVSTGFGVEAADLSLLKQPNIVFDTSGRSIHFMPDFLRLFGVEKFAFGSHSPILDYVTGMLRIESLRDSEASEKEKELLRSGNALRFLK
jgi:predicted TIM-barrel fold metal-dependent hydrolase